MTVIVHMNSNTQTSIIRLTWISVYTFCGSIISVNNNKENIIVFNLTPVVRSFKIYSFGTFRNYPKTFGINFLDTL